MLSIIAILDKLWGMLFSNDIHDFTIHKTSATHPLKMKQVLCWCNKLEVGEFLPSGWLCLASLPGFTSSDCRGGESCQACSGFQSREWYILLRARVLRFSWWWNTESFQCFLNLPDITHPDCNPLIYTHIYELQQHGQTPSTTS
jgi:hypothetical protein